MEAKNGSLQYSYLSNTAIFYFYGSAMISESPIPGGLGTPSQIGRFVLLGVIPTTY